MAIKHSLNAIFTTGQPLSLQSIPYIVKHPLPIEEYICAQCCAMETGETGETSV